MNENDKEMMKDNLINLIVNLNDKETCRKVLKAIITEREMLSISKRLETARMLKQNAPYSEIAAKTDANAYVITTVNDILNQDDGGMDLALSISGAAENYTSFASFYDKLMEDLDYEKRFNYILQIFEKYELNPKLVLDLACGTGTMTTLLAKHGFDMTGVDVSLEMLDIAKQKAQNLDILYLNQPMQDFELYGSVDAVLCLLDSLNYLTEIEDLKRTFDLVHNYLEPGGLFIFDVNTKYKLETVLAGNVFAGNYDNVFYTWQNVYDPEQEICEFELDFFVRENGLYRRHTEIHHQKAYTAGKLINLLKKAGFEVLGNFEDLTFDPPSRKSEKVFYIARKI